MTCMESSRLSFWGKIEGHRLFGCVQMQDDTSMHLNKIEDPAGAVLSFS